MEHSEGRLKTLRGKVITYASFLPCDPCDFLLRILNPLPSLWTNWCDNLWWEAWIRPGKVLITFPLSAVWINYCYLSRQFAPRTFKMRRREFPRSNRTPRGKTQDSQREGNYLSSLEPHRSYICPVSGLLPSVVTSLLILPCRDVEPSRKFFFDLA